MAGVGAELSVHSGETGRKYKNLSPVTTADGIPVSRWTVHAVLRFCQSAAETVTQEPEISIRTAY